jgi:hypothetical protein
LISERGPGSASRCGTCRQEREKREQARQGWMVHHLIRDPTALPYVEILGLWVGRRARAAQCPLGAWNPELHDPSAPAHHACVAESGQKDGLCLFIWLGCLCLCKEETFQFIRFHHLKLLGPGRGRYRRQGLSLSPLLCAPAATTLAVATEGIRVHPPPPPSRSMLPPVPCRGHIRNTHTHTHTQDQWFSPAAFCGSPSSLP